MHGAFPVVFVVVCVLILSSSDRGLLFGLSEGEAKAAVSTNCRAAMLHGGEHL